MLTDEQLAMRRTGIGGSEIAAVLGESRFAAPFDVWLSKTQGWRQEETEDMRRGSFLENGIARWYAHRMGVKESELDVWGTIRHAEHSFALCTPDRSLLLPVAERLVSIKAPRRSLGWGEEGTDQVPTEYVLQLQWEHAVCSSHGALSEVMHLAALLDGDLRVYEIRADEELQAWMLDYAGRWWARHVVGGEAPPLDGSSQAKAWLRSRFPQDSGVTRAATPHEVRLMLELEMAEQASETAAAEREAIANQLRLSMGDASRLDGPNGSVAWKTDKRGNKAFRTKWKGTTP